MLVDNWVIAGRICVLVDTEIVVMYCVITGKVWIERDTEVTVVVTAGGVAVMVLD